LREIAPQRRPSERPFDFNPKKEGCLVGIPETSGSPKPDGSNPQA
jgi:hypothetical protein